MATERTDPADDKHGAERPTNGAASDRPVIKDRKDYVIEALLQLNDDLRGKIINLYVEAKMASK